MICHSQRGQQGPGGRIACADSAGNVLQFFDPYSVRVEIGTGRVCIREGDAIRPATRFETALAARHPVTAGMLRRNAEWLAL